MPYIDKVTVGSTTYDIQDSNAYVKPSGGVPASDLSTAVQTSLGRADSALQSSDIDSLLTTSGKAADAKATGDAIAAVDQKYSSLIKPVSSWAEVQRIVRGGFAQDTFHIGEQLVCMKDNTPLVWDIVDIDNDSQFDHHITLQLHDCWPDTIQFSAAEALYYCESGLASGTYYFSFASGYEPSYVSDYPYYKFTLAQAVPSGGHVNITWAYNTKATTAKISTYASASSSTPIESNISVIGSTVTGEPNLGEFGNVISSNKNDIVRARYGNANYKNSAVRQWLNSNAAVGGWWTPQTNFDRPPAQLSTLKGWMNGIDSDFLSVIATTSVVTAALSLDGGDSYTTNDKFFLPSVENIYGGKPQGDYDEGPVYAYYKNYSSSSTPQLGEDVNRIKYSNNTAVAWEVRTASIRNAAYHVTITGLLSGTSSAYVARRIAPVCNIA